MLLTFSITNFMFFSLPLVFWGLRGSNHFDCTIKKREKKTTEILGIMPRYNALIETLN